MRGYRTTKTPQSEPLSGQVPNSAGGNAWQLDDWKRLERFLILGTDGGTYYIDEKKLTGDNARVVEQLAQIDPKRVVDIIVAISDGGRAPKNDPALFALAIVAKTASEEGRAYANAALPKVARIGTHLLHYAQFIQQFGGWGKGTRHSFQRWLTGMSPDQLAFQAVKYPNRDKWRMADLLRKAHPKSPIHNDVFKYIVDGVGDGQNLDLLPRIIKGTELIKDQIDPKLASSLIAEYHLPREVVPTQLLNDAGVWDALLNANMGLTAMIRNLGKMTSIGLLAANSTSTNHIVESLSAENLKKARVHPLVVLVALKTYAQGHGEKGSLTWQPVRKLVDALDASFYMTFQNVEPTGKSHLLALDISGSMGAHIAGMPLSCREASAAMALITANVESEYEIVGFSSGNSPTKWPSRYNTGLSPLSISPRQRLDDVVKYIAKLDFGGTDCSLPMVYALNQKLEIDAFFVYTDSETWAGNIHPKQALTEYRQKMGRAAKSAVVGMEANEFTIADPNDSGMLDVVGFDTATPAVMADFVRN